MARFSQGLLTGLGQPAMLQDFRLMGAALGNVPSQYRAKKAREANAAELQGVDRESPEYFEIQARQAEAVGDMQRAANLMKAAQTIRSQQVTESRAQVTFDQEQEDRARQQAQNAALSRAVISQLETKLEDPSLTGLERRRVEATLRAAEDAGENAAVLAPMASAAMGLGTKQNQVELSKTFTPGSIEKYMEDLSKGGDGSGILEPIAANSGIKNLRTEVIDGRNALVFTQAGQVIVQDMGAADLPENVQENISENREIAKKADADADRYKSLAPEIAARSFTGRGAAGLIKKSLLETLGYAGREQALMTELQMLQTENAIAMLPPGVASDRDVQLVMDSTVNLNNLTNEQAARLVRGMAKIKRAQAKQIRAENEIKRLTRSLGGDAILRFDELTAAKGRLNMQLINGGQAAFELIASDIQNAPTDEARAKAIQFYMNDPETQGIMSAYQDVVEGTDYFMRQGKFAEFASEYL